MTGPPAAPPPGPYRTAEVRWFAEGAVPAAVAAWFDALGDPVGEDVRTDRYLGGTGDGLGLKVREGRVEAKRFEGAGGAGRVRGVEAETWAKWLLPTAGDPAPPGWVAVRKRRRQRRAEAAGGSCAVEVSEVEAGGPQTGGAVWWSVCLEASGPTAEARRAALAHGAALWLGRDDAPALPPGAAMGYPAWLARVAPRP